ncbi:flagellar brake protein [Noviherbaspirillum galbum]|uniref:Flagellar brake protein n=1 Tax=Noviherbaspirillum galbum TaxID=2709383 RepID=A0A6B3SUP2_9BURK|nr:PilZ domain-containing protein [Noviherbaspirillum galbum]NEX62606.1 flagellar brake protein [Noviherbaspirillum galbum]
MTEPVISLVPVRGSELAVGKPLSQSVYDWHGKLLLGAGCVIESASQLESLTESGYVADSTWDLKPAEPKPSPLMKPSVGAKPEKPAQKPGAPFDDDQGKEVVTAMDDIRWQVNETLYLQQIDNPNIRYTVRMIGFMKGKMVFVTPPAADGKFEFVREGQIFVARAFSGKKAYAFAAAAMKSVMTPHPYLLLSYPKEVRCTVVRRGVRAAVKLIASVTVGQPERTGAATLTDMSIGGTSGLLKQAIGVKGDEGIMKFKVHAAGQDEFLSVKIVLRSVAQAENGEGFRHGFEFVDLSIHDRLILSAFVHQTLAEGE